MGKEKDVTTAQKRKITKLLSEGIFTMDISKEICRYHRTLKKAVRNLE